MASTTLRIVATFAALCVVGGLTGCTSDHQAPTPNASSSAQQSDHNAEDITFARAMVPHHEQAVEMAQMVPTNTSNRSLLDLANNVISTQVPEIQALRVWLMNWQDAEGNDTGHDGMPMNGMVDRATMDKLRDLRGTDFDRLWMTSMIGHHRGAIAMAQQEVAHGKNPDVIYLAKSVIAAQQAEIDQMNRMLGG